VAQQHRLESWKEIAAYLKRGVRTVRRWEKEEALPVHRQIHKKLGTVYAHVQELDAWREGRRAMSPSRGSTPRLPTIATRLMIAVLPFENLTGESDQEYIADGLTEEMIGQLGRVNPETLGVIARTTVMRYKRTNKSVRRIGDELNVDFIVEGSVRSERDRVRVTAQLINARDQAHVWSGACEQAISSILTLQRELAEAIGREIHLKLVPRSSVRARAVSPEAYQWHLKGRQLLNEFTPRSVRESVELFGRAIAADPAYAPAYASLAEAHCQLPMWLDEPSATTLPKALVAAEQALKLDPDLPEAYASLGLINTYYLWNWEAAERNFRHALRLNPSCSPARQWYTEFLAEMGRIAEALDVIDTAIVHDPMSRSIHATRAFALTFGRRFDEAIAQAKVVLELDPDYPMALIRIGLAYCAKGMHDEAIAALRRADASSAGLLDCKALLGYAYARAGRRVDALNQLSELRRLAADRYVPPFLFCNITVGLGEYDEAIRSIEQEYDARGWYLLLARHGAQFDPLRSHPHFQLLMRKMNFPE
jgi:TolB-like protein/Tfp pilus assembly protein PilF